MFDYAIRAIEAELCDAYMYELLSERVFQRVICVMVTHTVMMAKMMLICMNYYLNGDEILVIYLLYLHPSFTRCTTIMYIYVYFLDFGVKCSMTSD